MTLEEFLAQQSQPSQPRGGLTLDAFLGAVDNRRQPGESVEDYRARLTANRDTTTLTPEAQAMQAQAEADMQPQPGILDRMQEAYRGADLIGRRMVESATLGLASDEALAGIDTALGRGSYNDNLNQRQTEQQQFAENNPGLALGADIGGAFLPGTGTIGLLGRLPNAAARVAGGVASGGLSSALYGFMTGDGNRDQRVENAMDMAPTGMAIGGAVPAIGGLLSAAINRPAVRRAIDAVPSSDELRQRAGNLYDAARQGGVTASGEQMNGFASNIRQMLANEGLIRPSGAPSTNFPAVRDSMQLLEEFAGAEATPAQLLQIRRNIQIAARSADPAERRVGTMMLQQFDQFTDPLAPTLREANQTYRRAMQGDLIETTVELAGARAGQFTGSGFENALRTEFRNLDRQIIRGQLNVSDEERRLIERIARGGPVENIARDIGRAAPRGIVSTGLASGVPFMVGNAFGGPIVGGAAAAGALAAGEVGRRVATGMQTRNAGLLSAVARNGGQPLQVTPPRAAGLLQYLEGLGMGAAAPMSDRIAQ